MEVKHGLAHVLARHRQCGGHVGGDARRTAVIGVFKAHVAAAARVVHGGAGAPGPFAAAEAGAAAEHQSPAQVEGLHAAAVLLPERIGSALDAENGVELTRKHQLVVVDPLLPHAGLQGAVQRPAFGRADEAAELHPGLLLAEVEVRLADVASIYPEAQRQGAGAQRNGGKGGLEAVLNLSPLAAEPGAALQAGGRRHVGGVEGGAVGVELGKGGGLPGEPRRRQQREDAQEVKIMHRSKTE